MKSFLAQNVYDAALDRIRYLFNEFPNIIINISGGKDSTVIMNLSLQIAEEKGRLPLKVMFIDQEAEWETVINYIRQVFQDPRIDPVWLQIPIKIFNATSTISPWLYCWEEGKEWIRPKEPNSYKINKYGTDRFHDLFTAYMKVEYPDQKACQISGVRCEESPARAKGLTSNSTYKWITWGNKWGKSNNHFTFYPIYDWSYTDVWKAIHTNGWPYCPIYDYMYQYGVPVVEMRVSNVHHETAVRTLFYLQEVEGKTWDKITQRISGINTAGQLQRQFLKPTQLPFMFKDWWEYRDYLLDHLITDSALQEKMRYQFKLTDNQFTKEAQLDLVRTEIACILVNDYHMTKLTTFHASHGKYFKGKGKMRAKFEATYGVI